MANVWRKSIGSRAILSVVVGASIFAALALLREAGSLQGLELGAYDWMLRVRPRLVLDDNPVVLVKVREEEIQKYGHPLCDARLAMALAKLQDAGPRAIGVDIWRDIPITSCTGRAGAEGVEGDDTDLAEVVTRDDRVVMLAKPLETPPIAPPAFLDGTDQIAVPDFPIDPNGIVHRAILYYGSEEGTWFSLSLMLAMRYLRAEEIYPVNDPDAPDFIRLGETTIPIFVPDEGGYVDAGVGGYQYLLDFALGHEGFPSYPLDDVLSGAVPEGAFDGKVVVVGTHSTTVKDEFYSPLSDGMPGNPFILGMELHAHAVSQLIRFAHGDAPPIRGWPSRDEYLWIALWCALGALLGHWNRSIGFTAVAGGAGLAALVFGSMRALEHGLWIPVAPPLLGAFASAGIVGMLHAILERRERGQVTGLFSQFLRPELAELIWQQRDQFWDGQRPRARSITITSLMSDLQGYTTASEAMGPEALMGWVNEYMNLMADLVSDYGGIVDDYAGDGIKANFGFPIASEDADGIARDAENAVACALAMGAAMDELNRDWLERGMPTGRVRVGIHTGPVVVGVLGGGRAMKYTTVGDTVNTAARLESFDKDAFSAEAEEGASWRALISGVTMETVRASYEVEDLGSHTLKGKHEEIRIFRVLGASQSGAGTSPGA